MRRTALILDIACVLLFVGIGRSTHQHGVTLTGMASTAWPFGVGLLLGWGLAQRRRPLTDPTSGILIVVVTVALGMVLRVAGGQGIALAFVLVALAFLTLFLVGWRLIAALFAHLRGRGTR